MNGKKRKNMIKKENKLIQITLDPESLELLNSLASRFHISKTDLIKQAIKIFAASKKHHYHVYINTNETVENIQSKTKETVSDEQMEEILQNIDKMR